MLNDLVFLAGGVVIGVVYYAKVQPVVTKGIAMLKAIFTKA